MAPGSPAVFLTSRSTLEKALRGVVLFLLLLVACPGSRLFVPAADAKTPHPTVLRRDPAETREAAALSDPKADAPRPIKNLLSDAIPLWSPLRSSTSYEPVQLGIFDANGAGIANRVNNPMGGVPFGASESPPLPNPQSVLPDSWLGWHRWLLDKGFGIYLDNTNEFANAMTSPTKGHPYLRKGGSNAGQYSLENDIDWGKLAGLTGFETHMIGVGRYGIPASRMFGDQLIPSSEIYGGGGSVFFHLVWLYGEKTWGQGKVNLAAGRMSLLTDFSSNPLYCTFMNNMFCGNLRASTDMYSRFVYPASNWGARVRYRPTAHTYVQVGIYFPEHCEYTCGNQRTGFKWNSSNIDGQTVPFEVGYEPVFGKQELPGHYKIGVAPDTSRHVRGSYYPSSHPGRDLIPYEPYKSLGIRQKVYHGDWSTWFQTDQMLMRNKTKDTLEGGLILLAGFYYAGANASTKNYELETGLIDTGFWKARPLDTAGINFGFLKTSPWNRRIEKREMALVHGQTINGKPYNGLSGTDLAKYCQLVNGSCGLQNWVASLEIIYRAFIYPGVFIQPDFQYYFNPNAEKGLKNALMLGAKTHIQLF